MIKKPQQLIETAKSRLPCVTAEEAKAQSQRIPGTLVLDVREPDEVAASAVPGAVNIPRGVLEMKIEQAAPAHDDIARAFADRDGS